MKIEGSGSGSISQRHGSADPDPDPHQNVTDPQHWEKDSVVDPDLHWIASNIFLPTQVCFRLGNAM